MAPSGVNSCLGPGGRYRVLDMIETGSNGTQVWTAHDTWRREICAIKVLPRPLEVKYIKREALIHSRLSHQHVVNFRGVFDWGPRLCMVMEYCPNNTLFDYIHMRGCLTEDEARKYSNQIASGLKYLHEKGIVLRDLKLENILLDKDWNVKICDLGFATSDDFSRPKSFLGSMEYFAPELIKMQDEQKVGCAFWKRGQIGNYDGKKVDTWTFGICLYAMLFGQTPFCIPTEPPAATLHRTRSMSFKIPSQTRNLEPISHSCRSLIREILDENPKHRLSVDSILEHEWMKQCKDRKIVKGQLKALTRMESLQVESSVKRAAGWRRFFTCF